LAIVMVCSWVCNACNRANRDMALNQVLSFFPV